MSRHTENRATSEVGQEHDELRCYVICCPGNTTNNTTEIVVICNLFKTLFETEEVRELEFMLLKRFSNTKTAFRLVSY